MASQTCLCISCCTDLAWYREYRSKMNTSWTRVAQVDLPPLLGVDLVHCEREAGGAVADSAGAMRLVQGELVTDAYFDSVADEIDETLQVYCRRLCKISSRCVLDSASRVYVAWRTASRIKEAARCDSKVAVTDAGNVWALGGKPRLARA